MSVLILDDQWYVAKRGHQCTVCWGKIAEGDLYHRQRNVMDGDAYTFKAHALCDEAYQVAAKVLNDLWDDEEPDTSEVLSLIEDWFGSLCWAAP